MAQGEKSVAELAGELWELVKGYVVQETVDPVKAVGRFVAFGVLGAFLIGLGAVMLAVAGLRLLQEEGGSAFEGDLSWLPYLLAVVALTAGGALSVRAATRRREERR